jgi:hypothetical protein
MSIVKGNMSRLFSSLGADDSNFQKISEASSHEAEQRWPLLKAIGVRTPMATPPLTEQEKKNRFNAERVSGSPRKPPLTVPGLGHKLSEGLGRMSGAKRHAPSPEPLPEMSQSYPATAARRAIHEQPEAAQRMQEHPLPLSGLFGKPVRNDTPSDETPQGTKFTFLDNRRTDETTPSPGSDQSLASVFARLEGRQDADERNANTRPPFSRMVRR